jgi:hypothetical protein
MSRLIDRGCNKENLTKDYYHDDLPLAFIAVKYNTSQATLRKLFRENGIKLKSRSAPRPTRQVLSKAYKELESLEKTATNFDTSSGMVRKWLSHYKIPFRRWPISPLPRHALEASYLELKSIKKVADRHSIPESTMRMWFDFYKIEISKFKKPSQKLNPPKGQMGKIRQHFKKNCLRATSQKWGVSSYVMRRWLARS